VTNPLKSLFMEDLALLLTRVPLGAYVAVAGYAKIFDVGVRKFADKSMGMWPTWLPEELGRYYLTALPFVELIAGVMLVIGLLGRVAAGLIFLMLVSIIIAVAEFKDSAATSRPFHTNYILVGAALLLTCIGSGGFSVDRFLFRGKAPGPAK
jgi:putative oxidoreductase